MRHVPTIVGGTCGVLRLTASTEAFGKDFGEEQFPNGRCSRCCQGSIHIPQVLLLQLPVSAALGEGLYPRFPEHSLPTGPGSRKSELINSAEQLSARKDV